MYLEQRKVRQKFHINGTVIILLCSVTFIILTFVFIEMATKVSCNKEWFDQLTDEETYRLWSNARGWMTASIISFIMAILTIILAVIKERKLL